MKFPEASHRGITQSYTLLIGSSVPLTGLSGRQAGRQAGVYTQGKSRGIL